MQKWYKVWLWWGRLGYIVTTLQGVGALYFAFLIATISAEGFAYRVSCGRGKPLTSNLEEDESLI